MSKCVACSAISAARSGDHSTHRHLMSQARAVRAEAERAHEEAAESIEHVMNAGQGRGMWELDLHGLHAPEVRSLCFRWRSANELRHVQVFQLCSQLSMPYAA